MLSFVVENSTISPNIYPKSPRHLMLNKLTGANITRLLVKNFNLRFFNKLINDSLWCYYKLFSYINKSTVSLNLVITSCYFFISMFLNKNLTLPYDLNSTKHIFQPASMLTLPIYKHTNNLTLIMLLAYSFNSYPAAYVTFTVNREYMFLLRVLQKYPNLNFYYLRTYAH